MELSESRHLKLRDGNTIHADQKVSLQFMGAIFS